MRRSARPNSARRGRRPMGQAQTRSCGCRCGGERAAAASRCEVVEVPVELVRPKASTGDVRRAARRSITGGPRARVQVPVEDLSVACGTDGASGLSTLRISEAALRIVERGSPVVETGAGGRWPAAVARRARRSDIEPSSPWAARAVSANLAVSSSPSSAAGDPMSPSGSADFAAGRRDLQGLANDGLFVASSKIRQQLEHASDDNIPVSQAVDLARPRNMRS